MSYPDSGDPSQRAYGQYGAQPNPSDRVLPPPSSGPGAPHSPATAQPSGYGAVPRPPVFGTGGFPGSPPPGPPRKGNGGIWIVVAVLTVVAVILGGVFGWFMLRDDATPAVASGAAPSSAVSDGGVPGGETAPTAENSPEPGPATLPAGAQTCPATVASSSGLRGSAVGSTVTSCPFAEEVRLAYTRAGSDRNSRTVVASSPVTGKRYDMNCVSSAQLVTCTGGENAVVYLF